MVSVWKELIVPKSDGNAIYPGYIGAVLSFIFFTSNAHYLLPLITPSSVCVTEQKAWKWRNTVNSAIHSIITGSGSLINLWLISELRENLISTHTFSSVIINSISVGYFIYDFIDLMANNWGKRNTSELLLHHALVILCFGLAMVTCKYQGYAMVSLLLEINSVFLHLRQLCILHSIPKYMTFLGFRLLPLSWQINWLTIHRDEVATSVVTLGFVTCAIIMIINLGLLLQIIKKDFIRQDIKSKSD